MTSKRKKKCQHQEFEDCLICACCGECDETLNDDDICSDCFVIKKLIADSARAEELIHIDELEQYANERKE
jgi:hypothetical protein